MSFGDSVTYWGCNWLAIRMEEDPYLSQFNPVHMNQGTRGEKVTDAGTLVRWQDVLSFYDLDFAVLMHAVNDLTDARVINETITLEQIQQSMISMIDACASTQTTPDPLHVAAPRGFLRGYGVPTTEEYNAWLSSYAAQRGISLVDVYDDFLSTPGWGPLYFGTKCLHPDADGYARIAELVNEKIVEIFLPTCTDLDTDGYGDPAAPPCPYPDPDCDDSNPDVHPGIIEASYGDPVLQ